MIFNIGLKLWSVNTDHYFEEAKKLYKEKIFSYIELYVLPNSLKTIDKWKTINIPINIHCPHFMHGFNLAEAAKHEQNYNVYKEVKMFADELDSEYIIFHGGIDGKLEETAMQLKSFNEKRAVIENKPRKPMPFVDGKICRGSMIEEIEHIIKETGCGFCLDIGHAICSANSQKIDIWKYIEEFNKLNPKVYHLTDLYDINSEYDSHAHFSQNHIDMNKLFTIINNSK